MRLILIAGLTLSPTALAHPGGHGDSDGYAPPRSTSSSASTATEIPALYSEVLAALDTRAAAATTAMEGLKIVDVYYAVRAMADLAAALPAKSASFSAEGKAQVATRAATIKQQLDALQIAADKGNVTNGKAAVAAIQAEVDALATLK